MIAGSPGKTAAASERRKAAGRLFQSRYRRLWLYSVCFTSFVSLTPLVIMTCVNFHQYRKALREETTLQISRLTSISRRFMDDFLKEQRAALTYVVKRESYADLCDQEKLNRVFLDMKDSFGGFVDLGVIDSDGNQRSYVGPYKLEGKNYEEQEWFREVCIRGVYVSDVFLGHRNLPHFVIAVRQQDTENGGFYILRATIDTEVLDLYLSSLDLKPSSDAFLINRKGLLQTRSRHYGEVLSPCPISTPSPSSKTEVLQVTTTEGEPRILGYAYVEQTPFIFVVLSRPEDVMRSWLLLRSDILWLLATSIVLIVAVILWSSTSLVGRIREADQKRDKALQGIAYTNKMASIGRMAAGVAHEINNPLAIINENAGLLKDLLCVEDQPPEKDRLLKIAQTVLKSVERCSTITHRLLGFAKRMDPAIERVALAPLLEEVLSFHRKEAEYRSIAVHLDIPKDLPIIESDLGQLQQVFLNILSNAFAAVADGGRIDISLEMADQNTVAVTIADNGAGIPEEDLDRIFEPFFSTKGEYGTGLGLSITFGIVENLGGRIDVQSKVGEGTSFTVRLPIGRRR
jgi:two-component system NtrC family sensor kinase